MKLQIIAKNDVVVSETIQGYAEKKIGRLSRYLPSIGEGRVEISQEGAKLPGQRFTVQVTLDSKGTIIRAQEKAEDVRTAIDKVVDALTSRIERYKGKLYDGKEAMKKANVPIPGLKERDGLSIINGSNLLTAISA